MLKIFDLFTEKGIYNPQSQGNLHSVQDSEEIFADGRLLFKTVNLLIFEALRTCDIDIGILQCPNTKKIRRKTTTRPLSAPKYPSC